MTFQEPSLWDHQRLGVNRALASPGGFAWLYEPGCLTGDTMIRLHRCGKGFWLRLDQAFLQWTGNGTSPIKWDLSKQTKVRSFDGSRIALNCVRDIICSGVKEVFLLTLADGKQIKATADHEIMTRDGFVRLDSMTPGIEVMVDNVTKQKKSCQMRYQENKKRDKHFLVAKGHPYAYKTVRKHPQYRIELHRAVYEAHLNGMTLAQYKIAVKIRPADLKYVDPRKFHIHHKDGNHYNNDPENLECLPAEEHLRLHSPGIGNFRHLDIEYSPVESIEPCGQEMTYDIVCEDPHRNFVANGIVVHNCGKTLTTITTLRHLFTREKRAMRTLILGPSIVVANWADEISRFSKMGPLVMQLRGSRKERIAALHHPGKTVFVTNFESLDMEGLFWEFKGKTKVPRDLGFEVIVVDESHRMKNSSAARTKMLTKCRDVWRPKQVYLLTGTPILNSPMDIFSQWRILDGGRTFGHSFVAFRARFFENKNASAPAYVTWPDWVPKKGAQDEIANLMAPLAHNVKKRECLDLPPLVKRRIDIELSKEQQRDYHTMERDLVVQLREGALTAPIAATKLLRLQQIVSGSFETDTGEIHRYQNTPRLEILKELIEDLQGVKVIIWTPWAATYPTIHKLLTEMGRTVVAITGEQSAKAKDEAVARFRFGDADTVMANPAAAGTGVNLTEAQVAIWYARTFNLEHRLQGEARNYRGGSTMHSSVYQIDLVTKDSVDELVLEALERKENIGNDMLGFVRRSFK